MHCISMISRYMEFY